MPTLEMRTSERGSLKSCVQQWHWGIVEGLTPNRTANPLWFGSAVHEGLAHWYRKGFKRGPHPAETFAAYLEGERKFLVTNEDEELQYVDARALGISMLEGYVEHYGKDDSWDVIATEKTFQVTMKRPADVVFGMSRPEQRNWLRYVGTWDGVYRDAITGEIKLMEHKTAASIRVDHLPLDDQAGSYWAIADHLLKKDGTLKTGQDLAGIEYNFLRKVMPDLRPRNERGEYMNKATKKQHFVDALYNFYGEDSPAEEMESWYEDLPKMTMAQLQALADTQGLVVTGEVSATQPPPRYERYPVYRSRGERAKQISRIKDEAVLAEAYREGWLPITKNPDKMRCSYCQFQRMCQLDEQGDQVSVEEFKESQFHVRNPYEDHVVKSAE